jgi:hypothetical protein
VDARGGPVEPWWFMVSRFFVALLAFVTLAAPMHAQASSPDACCCDSSTAEAPDAQSNQSVPTPNADGNGNSRDANRTGNESQKEIAEESENATNEDSDNSTEDHTDQSDDGAPSSCQSDSSQSSMSSVQNPGPSQQCTPVTLGTTPGFPFVVVQFRPECVIGPSPGGDSTPVSLGLVI